MLLPVLPHMGLELQVESEPKRLAAVDLLGRLFAQSGGAELMSEYAGLVEELLKRLQDAKVPTTLPFPALYPALPAARSRSVLPGHPAAARQAGA